MAKQKYIFHFFWFCLQSNAIFGSSDYDYTFKILMDLHEGLARGHFVTNNTIKRMLAMCYRWPTLHKNIVLSTQNNVVNYYVMKLSKGTLFFDIKLLNITFVKN
jgi:hypothetical protein